ncbi:MAG: hypothetical protein II187_00445, partial [Treponema sp.]|nr:hypothetical protein [Treponema sp.]
MKKYSKKLFYMALALLIPLATLALLYAVEPPFYATNDDPGIQDVFKGCYTDVRGGGYPYFQFVNVFMGFLQVALFSIIPDIPWWFVTEIICAVVGAAFFNYTCFFYFD